MFAWLSLPACFPPLLSGYTVGHTISASLSLSRYTHTIQSKGKHTYLDSTEEGPWLL